METVAALGFAFLLFLVLALVAYFGMRSTLWSAIVFASMVAAAFLVFYYPPTKLVNAGVTVPLILYFAFVFVAFALVVTYVFVMAILDVRASSPRSARSACSDRDLRAGTGDLRPFAAGKDGKDILADCGCGSSDLRLRTVCAESCRSSPACGQGPAVRRFGAPTPEREERGGTPREREVRVTVFAG